MTKERPLPSNVANTNRKRSNKMTDQQRAPIDIQVQEQQPASVNTATLRAVKPMSPGGMDSTAPTSSASRLSKTSFPSRIEKKQRSARHGKMKARNDVPTPLDNHSSPLASTTRANIIDLAAAYNPTASTSDSADIDEARELPASYRVFNTTELLEKILLDLPAVRILRTRRVAQQFRAVVAESLALKRIIFFERQNQPPHGNPALRTGTYFHSATSRFVERFQFPIRTPSPPLKLVRYNPMVFFSAPLILTAGGLFMLPDFERFAWSRVHRPYQTSHFGDDMYLTNPPVKSMLINLGEAYNDCRCAFEGRRHLPAPWSTCHHRILNVLIRNKEGLKVSDLVAGIKKNLGDDTSRAFVVSSVMLPKPYEVMEGNGD